MSKKKNEFDFEQKLYDDFFSSQMYHTAKRAGNVVGKIVNQAVNEGLDKMEQSDFYRNLDNMHFNVDPSKRQKTDSAQPKTEKEQKPKQSPPQKPKAQKTTAKPSSEKEQPTQKPASPPMKQIRLKSNAPFYALGLTWILWAISPLPLFRPSDYLLLAGVSVGVFALSRLIFKGKKIWVPAEEPKKEPEKTAEPPKKSPSTGNPEADRIIAEGEVYLRKLADADVRIENESISASIRRMETACRSIFGYIAENPARAGSIRKFMNYYLPTTVKLLNTYDRLSRQGVQGENISSTMFEIEGMMQTIASAFEKQLDNLFADEALDVSADISVLETMLQQEGFVDDETPQI